MGKVFRLHDGADGIGWFDSTVISELQLEQIITDGKEVANSIPSPFARIELINDAFKWVAKNGIEGNTAQHRLVSEALDVGQLLYSIRKYSRELKVVDFNLETRIDNTFGSSNAKHKAVARTLKTYLSQDRESMGFSSDANMYLLFYRSELIGSTSPRSLFMSAPVSRQTRDAIVSEGSHGRFFSNKPFSLLRREWVYIDYLFTLSKLSGFSSQFSSFFDYLEKVKEEMSSEQREKVNELTTDSFENHEHLYVTGQPGNKVKVQDYTLRIAPVNTGSIAEHSGFIIDSDYETQGKPPMIIPNDEFSESWVYTTPDVLWNRDAFRGKVPYKNEYSPSESKLPVQNDPYPWLTAGNFFTDTIIKLPYRSDESRFVSAESMAGYAVASNYLIPLNDTFFNYFSSDKVKSSLKLKELGQGSVEAQLNIKVKAGNIVFKKTYTKDYIVAGEVNLAILPFVKLDVNYPARYTIGFYDADLQNNTNDNYKVKFYDGLNSVEASSVINRSKGDGRTRTTYYRVGNQFDRIKVDYMGNHHGYIIPVMPKYTPGADSCSFSVDFGTTNTHIEYKLNNSAEKAFDNINESGFWASLLPADSTEAQDENIYESLGVIEKELFPSLIGKGSSAKYPLRTALVENQDIDFSKPVEVFGHINKYLLYHNKYHLDYQRPQTELKWENLHFDENNKRLKAYFENTILLIYYKAISLNISFKKLSLRWFYPTSMGSNHRNTMDQTWKDCVREVFKDTIPEKSLSSMPESIGPYFYHYKREALSGLSVSIDIGGGSTDISVYDQNKMLLISSFRFAGNDLFGDGYGRMPEKNGFVRVFRKEAEDYLKSADHEGIRILKQIIEETESSHDFSSYLFSLSPNFDYADKISKNPHIKLVVVIFHAAIAFYVANLLKLSGYSTPNNILFSGTASKTLKIIDPSVNQSTAVIPGLLQHIMNKVFDTDEKSSISCILSRFPKEITCKGGLLAENVEGLTNRQTIWLGGHESLNKLQEENSNDLIRISAIDETHKQDIVASITLFYKILDNYFEKVDIYNEYGIDRNAYKKFKEARLKDAKGALETGLTRAKELSRGEENLSLEESLFFYPMKQELTKIAYELSEINVS